MGRFCLWLFDFWFDEFEDCCVEFCSLFDEFDDLIFGLRIGGGI